MLGRRCQHVLLSTVQLKLLQQCGLLRCWCNYTCVHATYQWSRLVCRWTERVTKTSFFSFPQTWRHVCYSWVSPLFFLTTGVDSASNESSVTLPGVIFIRSQNLQVGEGETTSDLFYQRPRTISFHPGVQCLFDKRSCRFPEDVSQVSSPLSMGPRKWAEGQWLAFLSMGLPSDSDNQTSNLSRPNTHGIGRVVSRSMCLLCTFSIIRDFKNVETHPQERAPVCEEVLTSSPQAPVIHAWLSWSNTPLISKRGIRTCSPRVQ